MREAVRVQAGVARRHRASAKLAVRACTGAMLLVAAFALADCGKKGPPQPPAGVPNVYPRAYPRE
jgi:hypothetical protein